MTHARQTRLVKFGAALIAVAVQAAFVALLLMPVFVRLPSAVRTERGRELISYISLPPLSESSNAVSANGAPAGPLTTNGTVLLVRPRAFAFTAPPAYVPQTFAPLPSVVIAPGVLDSIGQVIACSYAALESLLPEQRIVCEAMLARMRLAPLQPSYTPDQAVLRSQWAAELANKLAQPEWTSLNSLTSFCRWEQSPCWLDRYTTLGLARLDFLHGASIGRTFDLGGGWSAALGASVKSGSLMQMVSLVPERDPTAEFIAGVAVAYRW